MCKPNRPSIFRTKSTSSAKSLQLTKDIYSSLSPWQITKIARHPDRPYTLEYIEEIFTDFVELHGDRHMPTIARSWAAWPDSTAPPAWF